MRRQVVVARVEVPLCEEGKGKSQVATSLEPLQALRLKKPGAIWQGAARWRGNQLLPHYDLS